MPPKQTDHASLTPAAFHILLALAAEDQHGYGIIKAVLECSEGTVHLGPGTLYGNLKRFLALGWIAELEQRPAPDSDDERRRYYRLTTAGRDLAKMEAKRLEALVKHAQTVRLLRKPA